MISWDVNDKDTERLYAELRRKLANPPAVLWPPLPRSVRAKLAVQRVITDIGIRLIDHGHTGAAVRLWRACRMM